MVKNVVTQKLRLTWSLMNLIKPLSVIAQTISHAGSSVTKNNFHFGGGLAFAGFRGLCITPSISTTSSGWAIFASSTLNCLYLARTSSRSMDRSQARNVLYDWNVKITVCFKLPSGCSYERMSRFRNPSKVDSKVRISSKKVSISSPFRECTCMMLVTTVSGLTDITRSKAAEICLTASSSCMPAEPPAEATGRPGEPPAEP
mmetsp:Transcript_18202/g.42567  ORF Transcript_18202/g.42567 Transcript_18202/m.42567 type:complete len:202 (+) Transcript_18202:1230-1835(+)